MLAKRWRADGAVVDVVDAADGDDVHAPDERVTGLLRAADVVVLAVPEYVALTAVGAVRARMQPSAVLIETLSVKSRFASAVAGTDAPVVGVNPMFAPALGLPGRAVAVVVHHGGPAVDEFVADLRRWGGRVQVTSADHHDRLCAALQALTHATVLAFGWALADLDVDADEAAAMATPPFATMSALLARVTGGTPEVYRDVQTANPYASAARDALTRAVSRVSDAAVGDTGDFAALLARARVPLGDHDDEYAALCARLFEDLAR
ncbi:prephenate dehydrogenase dimerization domain-containing protein [Rhodococcus gannanensis]|uniref:Prephenate dehydrogenase dimerization domain-containing protein n=1 Tax=Rhodococcus gannanensis TaxID=1960308 RepID=A0ABW4P6E7_9NOCA